MYREREDFLKRKAELERKKKARTILGKSKDPDYFLDSINCKLEDLHNCYVETIRQIKLVKKDLREILRSVRKWKDVL